MLSAFQDGCVVDSERRSIVAHLDRCGECSLHLGQLEMVRQSLRAAPRRPMPAHLAFALRSLASREATRQRYYAGFRGFVRGLGERASLFANNLMRPLAVPAAGGLASAVFLFSMVMANFQDIIREHPNDVRLAAIATDASVRNILFEMSEDSEITLDILVDEQGRVVDYSFPAGIGNINTASMRRKLESTLLLTEFTPATTFGQPVPGWVRVKFSGRSEIDVKG